MSAGACLAIAPRYYDCDDTFARRQMRQRELAVRRLFGMTATINVPTLTPRQLARVKRLRTLRDSQAQYCCPCEASIATIAWCDLTIAQIERGETQGDLMLKTFAHHTPTVDGIAKLGALREAYSRLHEAITEICPSSRERAVALTELETSAMWATKSIVVNDPASEVAAG